MEQNAATHFRHARGIAALLTGVLLAPAAWAVHQQTNYALAGSACAAGAKWRLYGVTVAALAVIALGGVVAWRSWATAGRTWPTGAGGPVERSRFLAAVGVLGSALFFLVVAAQGVVDVVLGACD